MHADEVVGVHDSVDEPVQQDGEVDISIVENVNIEPVEEENGPMMVDVQERKLSPFLSKDNEDGIPEIPDLGGIKEPKQIRNRGVLTVERNTRHACTVVAVGKEEGFQGHVCTKHDLRHIVHKLDRVRIHGWHTRFHNGRTDKDKDEVRRRNVKGGTEIRVRPSLWSRERNIENESPWRRKDDAVDQKSTIVPPKFGGIDAAGHVEEETSRRRRTHLGVSTELVFRVGPLEDSLSQRINLFVKSHGFVSIFVVLCSDSDLCHSGPLVCLSTEPTKMTMMLEEEKDCDRRTMSTLAATSSKIIGRRA